MPNALQQAGAGAEPTSFAPLHTNRIFTGLWSNRSFLRDAATSDYQERYGAGRQDSIMDGYNTEITPRLTLARRPGSTVYNASIVPPVNRFYSFNTFNLTDEVIRVLADTATDVYDITGGAKTSIWHKSSGAGSTYFLGIGNILYMTDGVENKQWNYDSGDVWDWGIQAPVNAPLVSQTPRPNNYPGWQPSTAYEVNSPTVSGIFILDDLTNIPSNVKLIPTAAGGTVAVMCGQNYANGAAIALPPGDFSNTRLMVWTTPCYGYNASALPAGVYKSYGTGGVLNSSFQDRSGGFAFDATSNWIAIAWTSTGTIAPYTTGNYSGITFTTSAGDQMCFQMGSGHDTTAVNLPAGFSFANSLSMLGMISCDNVNHSMQGVQRCIFSNPLILNNYDDGSGNTWSGNADVFTVFWNSSVGTAALTPVTNGNALVFSIGGTNNMALIFCTVPWGGQFGIPPGFTLEQTAVTCAMAAHVSGGSNRAHGWNCITSGQNFVGYVMDSVGNQWFATGNIFAVAAVATASGGNVQFSNGTGTTGSAEPAWNPGGTGSVTADNTISWKNLGPSAWQPGHNYNLGDVRMGVILSPRGTPNQLYVCSTPGTSGASEPVWKAGVGLQQSDNTVVWTCIGRALQWSDLGPNTPITAASTIVDQNGYLQNVYSPGVSGPGPDPPAFSTELGALTTDNTIIWQNGGPFAVADTAPRQYGYEYYNPATKDLSEMSPPSLPITVMEGNHAVIQGVGSGDPQAGQIVLFRTAQGGSTFLQFAIIPNPGAGQTWTYVDDSSDDDLNSEWQAQVNGEGTPLPIGATCLAYHLQRIFAAVGNVVWISSGPDAIVGGSSGNAGFDTTFTAQSKITRFWPCALGLVVFTVRDAYIILGTATDSDPLYMVLFVEDLPLRSYDCFTVNKTTPYMLLGNNMLVALDPSAGITEIGFPIGDRLLNQFDSATSFVTYHQQSSLDAALYVANGIDRWYRMAVVTAPESSSAWSPAALIVGGIGCVQSVEVTPGQRRLLMSGTSPGPILQRDTTGLVHKDNTVPYQTMTRIGAIVLAHPGQLAALFFIATETAKVGSRIGISVLLGEATGTFEPLRRTRQDPPNLPPAKTLYSDRYHFGQSQKPAWCRHFQMEFSWPAEDVASELFTYTIFGQTWQEMRAQ
jgi:hypothetical protein